MGLAIGVMICVETEFCCRLRFCCCSLSCHEDLRLEHMLSVVRNFVLLAEVDFVGVLATAKCKESGGEKLRCN